MWVCIHDGEPSFHLENVLSDGRHYVVDAYNAGPRLEFKSQLQIICTEGCGGDQKYSDVFGDSLIGGFFSDHSINMLFVSGSVLWIRIYYIQRDGITKVLDQSSRELPDFETTCDGKPLVIVHHDSPGEYLGKEYFGTPPGLTAADRRKIRERTTDYWFGMGRLTSAIAVVLRVYDDAFLRGAYLDNTTTGVTITYFGYGTVLCSNEVEKCDARLTNPSFRLTKL